MGTVTINEHFICIQHKPMPTISEDIYIIFKTSNDHDCNSMSCCYLCLTNNQAQKTLSPKSGMFEYLTSMKMFQEKRGLHLMPQQPQFVHWWRPKQKRKLFHVHSYTLQICLKAFLYQKFQWEDGNVNQFSVWHLLIL